jgi:ribosomal protein L16 Arg81 hydroxylase
MGILLGSLALLLSLGICVQASLVHSNYDGKSMLDALLLPHTPDQFFTHFFEQRLRLVKSSEHSFADLHDTEPWILELKDPETFLSRHFEEYLAAHGGLTIRDAQGHTVQVASTWEQQRASFLSNGHSAVLKRELIKVNSELSQLFQEVFNTEVSAHAYISSPGAQALQPHTDPYDVFVLHVHGVKTWTVCTPSPTSGQARHTPAELAELQEIERHQPEGCTSYNEEDLKGMSCDDIILEPGLNV